MASAARRQIIGGGGAPIIKNQRRAYKLTAALRGRRKALRPGKPRCVQEQIQMRI